MTPPADPRATLRALVAGIESLASNAQCHLADLVYEIRDREGKGWEGPSVKAWSEAVSVIEKHLPDASPALAAIERGVWLEPGDLRHAMGLCNCVRAMEMHQRPGDRYERPVFVWPEEHRAALAAAAAELRAVEEQR